MNGLRYVNTYDPRNVPQIPDRLSRADKRNVELIFNHFSHLFAVEKDRRLLIDSLAYVIQNPGKRLNYALLMQGTRGDGKTFFFRLLAAMLGLENVTTIGPQSVEEKFTGWAEGHQIVFVEEIKLHGHNRYDVLNKLKPLITNAMIPVRRMNVDTYNVWNTATYFLATNHKDALPLDDNENRYAVLFSRFQTKAELDAFNEENPSYYDDLHDALNESAGAIRKSFLEWDLSPSFRPEGRAPDTEGRAEMVAYSKTEEQATLDEILAESPRLDMSRTLLNATFLAEEFDKRDCELPYGKGLTKLLLDAGFTRIEGKYLFDDRRCTFWSQKPQRFLARGKAGVLSLIREWLADDL